MTSRTLSITAGLLLMASCNAPHTENQWGARASFTVVDEYDLDVDGSEATADYESLQVGLHVRSETYDGQPLYSSEYLYGSAEYGDLDATELVIGSRYYLFASPTVRPFAGLYSSYTMFDDESGADLGDQVTLGPAVGIEWEITGNFFLDAMVDYAFPLFSAESDTDPVVEREAGGLAVRVGFGLDF